MPRRIIVKIGSQVLCDPSGLLNQQVLVSSGAVAAGGGIGDERLGRIADPVARKQMMAAAGQVRLMETYRRLFEEHGLTIARF